MIPKTPLVRRNNNTGNNSNVSDDVNNINGSNYDVACQNSHGNENNNVSHNNVATKNDIFSDNGGSFGMRQSSNLDRIKWSYLIDNRKYYEDNRKYLANTSEEKVMHSILRTLFSLNKPSMKKKNFHNNS